MITIDFELERWVVKRDGMALGSFLDFAATEHFLDELERMTKGESPIAVEKLCPEQLLPAETSCDSSRGNADRVPSLATLVHE